MKMPLFVTAARFSCVGHSSPKIHVFDITVAVRPTMFFRSTKRVQRGNHRQQHTIARQKGAVKH